VIAVVLKPFKLTADDGLQNVQCGQIVTIERPEDFNSLLGKGYVRSTDSQETNKVLNDYIVEATRVFDQPLGKALKPCYMCKEQNYWMSIYRAVICGTCHPPASDRIVQRWLRGNGCENA
jgi:hypothetical protein